MSVAQLFPLGMLNGHPLSNHGALRVASLIASHGGVMSYDPD